MTDLTSKQCVVSADNAARERPGHGPRRSCPRKLRWNRGSCTGSPYGAARGRSGSICRRAEIDRSYRVMVSTRNTLRIARLACFLERAIYNPDVR